MTSIAFDCSDEIDNFLIEEPMFKERINVSGRIEGMGSFQCTNLVSVDVLPEVMNAPNGTFYWLCNTNRYFSRAKQSFLIHLCV